MRTDSHARLSRRRSVIFILIILATARWQRIFLWIPYAGTRQCPRRASRGPRTRGSAGCGSQPPAGRTSRSTQRVGTVQASFTIGIHSQLDGIMQEALFTEGQHVKKGDVLAQIDRRPFQAASSMRPWQRRPRTRPCWFRPKRTLRAPRHGHQKLRNSTGRRSRTGQGRSAQGSDRCRRSIDRRARTNSLFHIDQGAETKHVSGYAKSILATLFTPPTRARLRVWFMTKPSAVR